MRQKTQRKRPQFTPCCHCMPLRRFCGHTKKSKASDLFGYPPMNLGRCGKSMTVLKMLKGNHKFPYLFPLFFLEVQPSILDHPWSLPCRQGICILQTLLSCWVYFVYLRLRLPETASAIAMLEEQRTRTPSEVRTGHRGWCGAAQGPSRVASFGVLGHYRLVETNGHWDLRRWF